MQIYNTMTRKKEDFRPIDEKKVRMYVCGPTVYSFIHIGNARPMIFFDTVRRYFEYRGYDVNYVSNFTDVDDKIIKAANEEHTTSEEIAERYIAECKKDMESLNVMPATVHPRATLEIDGMIDMIQTLIDKGFAYVAKDGTVYYRTRSFKEYGKLSHRNLDDLQSGNRTISVTGEDQKEDPLDFVLWKPKKEGEPAWPSPWCDGRPGWHIECSVMSKKYLGEQIDIHGGGEDLIFPHHENEIAQSEAVSGKTFANYWMHNGFINIDNLKMSKSVGNVFLVRDILKKYDGQTLRLFMLSAHYRSPVNYSDELLSAAKNSYARLKNCAENLRFKAEHASDTQLTDDEKKILADAEKYRQNFEKAMDDDLNTADAVSAVFELVKLINTSTGADPSVTFINSLSMLFMTLTDVLGLTFDKEASEDDPEETARIEELIEKRTAAKKNKDFAEADRIRDELSSMGIVIEDTREGVKWKRA